MTFDSEAVLDAMPDPFYAVGPDWRLLYVHRAAECVWNVRRAEVIGRGLLEVFPALAGSESHRAMQQAMATGEPRRLEAVSSVLGLPFEVDLNPMAWGLAIHVHDLTARKRMEGQLRERGELLTLAEQSAGVGVWEIDIASDTVRGTPQYFRIMGLEPTADPVPMARIRALRMPEDHDA
ncbi:MAG TPA: PAS domain-containing protein, partial [Acetobacteraceae bacterium]|nr:PAS domain-containing protein [Acetobacteraceae bacterium]